MHLHLLSTFATDLLPGGTSGVTSPVRFPTSCMRLAVDTKRSLGTFRCQVKACLNTYLSFQDKGQVHIIILIYQQSL